MASAQQKAFCVLEFAKTKSVITVQRAFRVKFNCDAPSSKNIRRWSKQFEESGCLCKGKSPGRPRTSEENVERVRAAFSRSPRQSTRRVSRALGISQPTVWRVLGISQPTVWRVLKKRLHFKPYKLQLVQALNDNDYQRRMEFCNEMLQMMEDNENFSSLLIFSDEATFHLNGKINKHNVRIWVPKILVKLFNMKEIPLK